MLSDALRQMRECVRTGAMQQDPAGFVLALKAYEIEARNLEERVELLSGRPHAALDGRLMSMPQIEIANTRTEKNNVSPA